MTLTQIFTGAGREGRLIATFGQAELIKTADGAYQLRGGSRDDRLSAYEWISLFMHHVVVREEGQSQRAGA